jgi:NAD(P)H dehydrogenase (quinone)
VKIAVFKAVADPVVDQLAATAVRAAEAAGHAVALFDLQADEFVPWMTAADRHAYHGDNPIVDPLAGYYAEAVRGADALVFVDRAQLSTVSPMLKGWLEKVMVPGVGFVLDERTHRVKRGLMGLQHLIGISVGDGLGRNGRHTIMRAFRLCTGWRTRASWIEVGGGESASMVAARIERKMSSL